MNGQFNLTKISFPIKLSKPKSMVENMVAHAIWNPIYMNLACRTTDPVERMKFIAVYNIIKIYKYDDGAYLFYKPVSFDFC